MDYKIAYYIDMAHGQDPRVYHQQCMMGIQHLYEIHQQIAPNTTFYWFWHIYKMPNHITDFQYI